MQYHTASYKIHFKTDRPIKTTPLANTLFIELLNQSGDTARLHRPNTTCRFGKPAFYSRKTEDLAVEAVTILSNANDEITLLDIVNSHA